MDIIPTEIPGSFEIRGPIFSDSRGMFSKCFKADVFQEHGINTTWREYYWNRSHKGVLRGLHFQVPPVDHAKLVTCVAGAAYDVGVDLRKESKTFGQFLAREISESNGVALYFPRGLAHGFLALREGTVLLYAVETGHSSGNDLGVHWNSCGIEWPTVDPPILSDRDANWPAFADFQSPF